MMQLIIDTCGNGRCLYSEQLDLHALGPLQIRRASTLEPDDTGQWWADLAAVNGPRLGPFRRRSDALAAEVHWLDEHLAPPSPSPPLPLDYLSPAAVHRSGTIALVVLVLLVLLVIAALQLIGCWDQHQHLPAASQPTANP